MVIIHRAFLGVADFVSASVILLIKLPALRFKAPYFSKFNDALLCLQA